jgi:hypothetical protein
MLKRPLGVHDRHAAKLPVAVEARRVALHIRPASSFASLLIHEGRLSVVEIAAQLGHRPTMTLNTYGRVIAELAEAEKTSAEELIRQARAEIRPIPAHEPRMWPKLPARIQGTPPERGLHQGGRSRTRTWDLFLIREAL